MIAAILGALAKSKLARLILYVIIGLAAFAGYTAYERHAGALAELAAEKAASAKEHQRRLDVEAWAQKWAEGAVARVTDLERTNANLQASIATASAANNSKPCFDSAAAARHNRLQSSRRKAGH